ncbi:MAG: hypothetical protein O2799_03180, partial [Planctomycetota bacterium]|nr:hypothetical protein [Planctomycetota bacterium]
IAAGQTSAQVPITVLDDPLDEADETVVLTLGAATDATVGAVGVHTLSITDDDAQPTVGFDLAAASAGEGSGSAAASVSLSAASGRDVSVPFVLGGTATEGVDFTLGVTSPLIIPAGQTSVAVPVTLSDDLLDEPSETVVLTLGAADFAGAGAQQEFVLTVEDDDATPTVGFVTASSSASEASGVTSIALALSAPSGQEVSVTLGVGGTATAGEDFAAPEATVVIPAGAGGASLDLSLLDDGLYEGSETIELQLQGASSADVDASAAAHVVTVLDDDAAPEVSFVAASSSVGEGAGAASVEVVLSAASGLPVTVEFAVGGDAVEGVDYALGSASPLVIAAGQTSAQVPITVLDDPLDEADETVVLTLGAATDATVGAVGVHTLSITDDDAQPTVALDALDLSVLEGTGVAPLAAVLSAPSGRPVTLVLTGQLLSAGPEDFVLPPAVVIPAGAVSVPLGLEVLADALHEGPEELQVLLSSADFAQVVAPSSTLISLEDADPQPTVSLEPGGSSLAEGAGSTTILVTLSGASAVPATVGLVPGGTATLGVDYEVSPLAVAFAPGQTQVEVLLTLLEDEVFEGDEVVQLALGPPVGATASGAGLYTLTLLDNDAQPTLSLQLPTGPLVEGSTGLFAELSLSAAAGVEVGAQLQVAGTAAPGTDHDLLPQALVLPSGTTSLQVPFSLLDDLLDEDEETLQVALASVSGAAWDGVAPSLAIADDDAEPTLTLSAQGGPLAEGAGPQALTISLDAPSGRTVSVELTAGAGTTASAADYSLGATSIELLAGQTQQVVTLDLLGDDLDEDDELLVLELVSPTNALLGGASVSWTLLDDDAAPSVGFATGTSVLAEDAGVAATSVEVVLLDASGVPTTSGKSVQVDLAVAGTALAGVDYTGPAPGTLILPAGTGSLTLGFLALDDGVYEGDEDLVLTLSNPVAAAPGALLTHTVVLVEDEDLPTVSFVQASSTADESGAPLAVELAMSPPSASSVELAVAVAGGDALQGVDYDLAPVGTLTLAPGTTTAVVTVTPLADTEFEGTETALLGLQSVSGAQVGLQATHEVQLLDDEPRPIVAFGTPTGFGTEGAVSILPLVLSEVRAIPVTVRWSATGLEAGEYEAPLEVVFAPGSLTAELPVTLLLDGVHDPSEQLVLSLVETDTAAADPVASTFTLGVDDADGPPAVSFGAFAGSLLEGGAPGSVPVVLDRPSTLPVDLSYGFGAGSTATLGLDFSDPGAGALSIPALATSASITVELLDDAEPEGVELIEVVLLAASGASLGTPASLFVPLVDDDTLTGIGEDFNSCGPDLPLGWEFVDPEGIGSFRFVGAGTQDASLGLTIPAGNSYPRGTTLPPRIRRAFDPGNFAVEVAFDSLIAEPTQMQGVLFEDGAGQWIRVDLSRTSTGTLIFFIGKDPAAGQNADPIANGVVNPEPLDGARLRFALQGSSWVVELWDGLDWYQPVANCAFELPGFSPSSIAVWAGNYSGGPGHEALLDSTQDSFAPLDPEDGPLAGGVGRSLAVSVLDDLGFPTPGGVVTQDPQQAEYWCGETVTLTATAQPGWLFERWEGDLVDPGAALDSAVTVVMDTDRTLAAVFTQDTTPPIVLTPSVRVLTGQEAATVSWSANQPTEAWIEYGLQGGALDTQVFSVAPGEPLQVDHAVVLTGLSPDSVYEFQVTVSNPNGQGTAVGLLETETPLRVDFNTCDPADVLAEWTLVDPAADLEFRVEGGGTYDAWAVLEVPGGVGHPANAEALPPRLERPIGRSLFEHEVVMASVPTQPTQVQGVIYRESTSDRWLGAFYQFVNGLPRYFIAFVAPEVPGGVATLSALTSGPVNGTITGLGFRVQRDADLWRVFRSQNDGQVWQNLTQGFGPEKVPSDFAPDRVALFVADVAPSGSLPAPGGLAAFDRIRTYDPTDAWNDEDGVIGSGIPNMLDLVIAGSAPGSGSGVQLEPGELFLTETSQLQYFCNQPVTLTAVPGPCEVFLGWQGDLQGLVNPQSLVMDAPRTVTALFGPDLGAPTATGVTVAAYGTSAIVRWQTDEPASSTVSYGVSGTALGSSVSTAGLVTDHEVFLDGLTPETVYAFEVSGADACQNPYALGGLSFDTGPVVLFQDEAFFAPNLDLARWDWDDPSGGLAGVRLLEPGTTSARLQLELLDGVAYDSGVGGAAPSLGQSISVGDLDLEARFTGPLGLDGQRRGFQLREGAESMEEILLAVEGDNLILLSRTTANGVVQERT